MGRALPATRFRRRTGRSSIADLQFRMMTSATPLSSEPCRTARRGRSRGSGPHPARSHRTRAGPPSAPKMSCASGRQKNGQFCESDGPVSGVSRSKIQRARHKPTAAASPANVAAPEPAVDRRQCVTGPAGKRVLGRTKQTALRTASPTMRSLMIRNAGFRLCASVLGAAAGDRPRSVAAPCRWVRRLPSAGFGRCAIVGALSIRSLLQKRPLNYATDVVALAIAPRSRNDGPYALNVIRPCAPDPQEDARPPRGRLATFVVRSSSARFG